MSARSLSHARNFTEIIVLQDLYTTYSYTVTSNTCTGTRTRYGTLEHLRTQSRPDGGWTRRHTVTERGFAAAITRPQGRLYSMHRWPLHLSGWQSAPVATRPARRDAWVYHSARLATTQRPGHGALTSHWSRGADGANGTLQRRRAEAAHAARCNWLKVGALRCHRLPAAASPPSSASSRHPSASPDPLSCLQHTRDVRRSAL